ncbi:wall-associated receptor kinase-like 20 [Diospyros lotus]|uniref:wall-associated receptor kinase-like 20 n=1 Tax=Diospyros lotus TaxID=55363 RepID=UPI0022524ACE|nr:wall-associated receptor kinase-like 20 [Diospyros lotus]
MMKMKPSLLWTFLFIHLHLIFNHSLPQRTCPNCGSTEIPYPLSTDHTCGDPNYSIRCDPKSQNLFFDALNGSSYRILRIMASSRRMIVRPSPWLPGTSCVTQDMVRSEGLWLNHTLPFNITSSNTIFLFNCSPRLLISPLNCTSSSLCHRFLDFPAGHVDKDRAAHCAGWLDPCCTFVAGGMPSAYKIRLHYSGCRAFRSVLNLDPAAPASQWEEGLEIQWSPPPEKACKTQLDCSGDSTCQKNVSRCICNRGYYWNHGLGICSRTKKKKSGLVLKVSIAAASSVVIAAAMAVVTVRKSGKYFNQAKLAKARQDVLKSNGGKATRMFSLSELKKATNGFSKDRFLGRGGFGEVYRGELEDGAVVAVKSAKVGDIKSTHQVLNEVGILSQVNHRNLVKLVGCCVEAEQPLMVYEFVSNGTLHDHLHGAAAFFLDWKTRLRIAAQTAEALAYLHSSAQTPVFHRDVKSTNILLDNEFNAKVADFGLSRLALPGLSHVSTCAQGTLGYLDPEYYRNYQLDDKSDVYSYGVVMLELLTSQKAIDFSRDQDDVNLVVYVTQRVSTGSILEVVDRRLLGEEPPVKMVNSTVKLFIEVALACLREKKRERPAMREVAQELQSIMKMTDDQEEEGSNELRVDII